jgi:hypothetical protein
VADKIILTDCDGVLLDWESKFQTFAERLGHRFNPTRANVYSIGEQYNLTHEQSLELIERFNRSSDFEHLEPWRDTKPVVQKLAQEGWRFVVITTAGSHPWTHGLRWSNLERVFGENVFNSLHVLPTHGDKGIELVKYKDSGYLWIEDKPSNAELGYKFGLRPLLMSASHNTNSYTGPVPRVNTWEDIYRIINQ